MKNTPQTRTERLSAGYKKSLYKLWDLLKGVLLTADHAGAQTLASGPFLFMLLCNCKRLRYKANLTYYWWNVWKRGHFARTFSYCEAWLMLDVWGRYWGWYVRVKKRQCSWRIFIRILIYLISTWWDILHWEKLTCSFLVGKLCNSLLTCSIYLYQYVHLLYVTLTTEKQQLGLNRSGNKVSSMKAF